jgi:hypothetical protein
MDVVASLEAGKAAIETITYIVKTVQHVRRLKKECEEIGKLAELIQSVLNRYVDVKATLQTAARVESNLKEVKDFVTHCTERSNIVQRSWEVIWNKKLPGLMAGLRETVLWFLMDAAVG